MEERLEKLISGCSNTGDLSGECYPMYGVYDLVEEFINDELTKARAEILTTLIKKVAERKWNYHMAKDMDRKYVLALDDVVTLLREDLTKKD